MSNQIAIPARHLEIFELVRIEDERELAARLETVSHSSISKTFVDPSLPSLSDSGGLSQCQIHD